jgi:hypothetical protein
MTKYSCYVHSQSPDFASDLPNPTELEQDLTQIKVWLDNFKQKINSKS